MLRKFWSFLKEHPICNKVIAGVIVAILVGIYSNIKGWWPIIGEFAHQQAIPLALAERKIPNWLFFVLCILAFLKIIDSVHKKFKRDWQSYKKDKIDGIVWRWYYTFGNFDKESVRGYCLRCDHDISASGLDVLSSEVVILKCQHCDKSFVELQKFISRKNPVQEYMDNIFGEIEKRIRKRRKI